MATKKSKRKQPTAEPSDPYYQIVIDHRPNILRFYKAFEDKRPVIVYDLQEERLYAYPYMDFKADLSDESQASLEKQYQTAIKENKVVVFVKDNVKKKLRSYCLR